MEEEEGVALGEEQEAGEYFPRCHFRPMGGEVRDGGGGGHIKSEAEGGTLMKFRETGAP